MVVSLQGIGMKRELTREEIEFLKWDQDREIDYDIFVTIPLHKSYHNKSSLFYDTIKRLLISNLNRSVFTNGEINRGKRLELMLVQEPRENCFHLKIKLPDCNRLHNKNLMYLKLQSMIEKHIRRMKLKICDTPTISKCRKTNRVKSSNPIFNIINEEVYSEYCKRIYDNSGLSYYLMKKPKTLDRIVINQL